jgi:membrane protease YdiL (CAAX protease family)
MQVKIKAVVEAVIVFSLTLLLVTLASLSPIGRWERQVSNRSFVEYAVMIAFPLLLLVITRRDLASYGLSLRHISYHLDVTATIFVPVAMGSIFLALVNYRQWSGSLILAGVEIVVLFAVGWLLKHKPTHGNGVLVGVIIPTVSAGLVFKVTVGNAVSAFIFYICFLGLGEELLFRGYIRSRLNLAFGRPFRFFGVNWGWGIIIASALLGWMHVLNLGSWVSGRWDPAW